MAVSMKRIALAATATLGVLLVATYSLTRKSELDAFAACRESQVMGGAGAIGGPFTLTDENGRKVTDVDVLSKPSLVYFGYTFCPDVCPTDVARNAAAVDILEEDGFDVQPVFISVDPRRDTPAQLKEWTDGIHPKLLGLTGTPDEIRAAAKAYKVFYQVPDAPKDNYYEVSHTTQTYLMLPKTGFADFFGRDDTADQIAERTACFLEAAKPTN